MKIIASLNSRSFLVEMTEDEISKAAGYYYSGSMPQSLRPEIGREIDVTEAYSSATALLGGCEELNKAKNEMLKLVKVVERFQGQLEPKAALIKAKLPKSN